VTMTTLSVRMNETDKKNFEEFCENVGMNVSVAINMFAKTVVREQRLPFEIVADPFYSRENQERLHKAIDDLNAGKGKEHELIGA
jgi:DNA-damage-inducible protein J